MAEKQELSASVVDGVSIERALQDAEIANRRVMELTQILLDKEERIAKLSADLAALKRLMDPRRKAEHVFRQNHTLYSAARRAKRMLGR
jgi:hypothetical protein